MHEDNDLLDHVNKIKAFADELVCLEVPVKDKDIIITLFGSLPTSFKYLITTLETMPMNELTMDNMTVHLMHKMSKRKEMETQGEDATMVQ